MEEWKEVIEYEGIYEVSNLGNVRGVDRILSNGTHWKGIVLKPGEYSNGYKFVCLRKDGFTKNKMIHRLVAQAFIPNPNGYKCVNHKDGDKANNKLSNLEWITHSENQKHASRIGLKKTKLSKEKLKYIKEQLAKGRSQQSISEELGTSQVLISQALLGKLYYLKGHNF